VPQRYSENAADSLHQSLRDVPRGGARETNQDSAHGGPLGARAINVERVCNLLREGVALRPLRLLPVGRPVPSTPDDHTFLDYALLPILQLAGGLEPSRLFAQRAYLFGLLRS
jgi:hypothetical protein